MYHQDRFDKFTERARRVLGLAQAEASLLGNSYMGTEHLLLGLVREGEGVAAVVLKSFDIELPAVRQAVKEYLSRDDQASHTAEIGLTPRARKVIELAVDEARRLNHHYIGTEHLLLGLVREGDGVAAAVLKSLGCNLEKVRVHTIQVLSQGATARQATQDTAAERTQARLTGWNRSPRWTTGPSHYKPCHIFNQATEKTPIGKQARDQSSAATLLGWVTVNTGNLFTLTLYHGMAEDAPKVAVITDPPTGATFPFYCALEHGLTYTLTGSPGSITIMYIDVAE